MVGLCVSLAAVAGYESSAGYAIPVDATFRRVLDVLKQGREAEYGFLGIQPAELAPGGDRCARPAGHSRPAVVPGTPAERVGLRDDDIIIAVNDAADLRLRRPGAGSGPLPVEAVARLGVIRDGEPQTIDVVLSKYPVRGRKIVTVRPEAWRGMRVDYASAFLEPEQPLQFGLPLTTTRWSSPRSSRTRPPPRRA